MNKELVLPFSSNKVCYRKYLSIYIYIFIEIKLKTTILNSRNSPETYYNCNNIGLCNMVQNYLSFSWRWVLFCIFSYLENQYRYIMILKYI